MFMVTKTLTIMEDAYDLLLNNKLEDESFSEELRRILLKKTARKLSDLFGIISDKEGEEIIKDLEKIKSQNIELIKKRIQWKY